MSSIVDRNPSLSLLAAAVSALALLGSDLALAEPLGYAGPSRQPHYAISLQSSEAAAIETPAGLRRHLVEYPTNEAAGTIVIDTPNTYLYFVLGAGKAIRYGIGVGREGFTWSGVKAVERKAEWPDWIPPADMLARQPYLPRFMAGGPGNPLGARAMYLAGTVYRIHGTNDSSTIGRHVSSGCIRMTNDDVMDLYNRVKIGAKVVVLPADQNPAAQAKQPNGTRTATLAAAVHASTLY